MNKRKYFYLDSDVIKDIKIIALENKVKESTLVQHILNKYIKENKQTTITKMKRGVNNGKIR